MLVPIAATDPRVWTVCFERQEASEECQKYAGEARQRPVESSYVTLIVRTSAVVVVGWTDAGASRGHQVWYNMEQEQRGRHPGRRRWWRSFWLVMVGAACHLISCPSRTWVQPHQPHQQSSSATSGSLGEYFFHLSGGVLHGAY